MSPIKIAHEFYQPIWSTLDEKKISLESEPIIPLTAEDFLVTSERQSVVIAQHFPTPEIFFKSESSLSELSSVTITNSSESARFM